jgi:hypothetical protein
MLPQLASEHRGIVLNLRRPGGEPGRERREDRLALARPPGPIPTALAPGADGLGVDRVLAGQAEERLPLPEPREDLLHYLLLEHRRLRHENRRRRYPILLPLLQTALLWSR